MAMGLWARLAELFRPSLSEGSDRTDRQRTGARGEKIAASHLILERNFRTPLGEIDIIAFRDGVVAFVEVRTVTGPARFDPRYTVNRTKQQRLVRAARQYASRHNLERENILIRFDLITVDIPEDGGEREVKHYPDAFDRESAGN